MANDKIREDEILSDDELDAVAGGTLQQSADDSLYLNDILYGKPGQCDQYGKTAIFFHPNAMDDIKRAWKSVGVTIDFKYGENKYYSGGEQISRRRAYEIAWVNSGRNLNDLPSSWGT